MAVNMVLEKMADSFDQPQIQSNNQNWVDVFNQMLEEDRFDSAAETITKIRKDLKLQKALVRHFIRRLGSFLQNLPPQRTSPNGWLRQESSNFADMIESAIIVLQEPFAAVLVEECAFTETNSEHCLISFFVDLFENHHFTVSDGVKMCLAMAIKNRVHITKPFAHTEIYEKLCNILTYVDLSPLGTVFNPFQSEQNSSADMDLSATDSDCFFFKNKDINRSELLREIAIARACAAIAQSGEQSGTLLLDPVNTCELFKKLLELKFFTEAVLLARHGDCLADVDSKVVFAAFTDWIMMLMTFAVDHMDSFFQSVVRYIDRRELLDAEKVFQRGHESAEAYIERILYIVQGDLMDLYLELGSLEDLKVIVRRFIHAKFPMFARLKALLVEPRYFREFVWLLISCNDQHDLIYLYVMDWAAGVSGESYTATYPSFSMHEPLDVELPYIDAQLYGELRNHFNSSDPKIQLMWTALDERLQMVNQTNPFLDPSEQVPITHRKHAEFAGN